MEDFFQTHPIVINFIVNSFFDILTLLAERQQDPLTRPRQQTSSFPGSASSAWERTVSEAPDLRFLFKRHRGFERGIRSGNLGGARKSVGSHAEPGNQLFFNSCRNQPQFISWEA